MKLRNLVKIISGLLAAVLILTALPSAALHSRAATGTAQAIWTEGNTTLTFLVSETVYTAGGA